MIVRLWAARGARANADWYLHHFRRVVEPALLDLPGFLGASVLTSDPVTDGDDGHVEIVVLTRWTSLSAVRSFAGDDLSRAVVAPAVAAALESYDHHVRMFEIAYETP